MGSKRPPHPRQILAACAALLAVILRVLVPAGFMLAADANAAGGVAITICTGSGVQHAVLAPDGQITPAADPTYPGSSDGPADGVTHADCAFAASPVGALTPPAAMPVRLSGLPLTDGPLVSTSELVPGRGLAAPPPPSTAPPA